MILALSNGYDTLVDEGDLPLLEGFGWYARREGRNVYAAASAKGTEGTRGAKIRMHRLIMGAGPGEIVDHINGDTLDNRRSNLRICTNHQNQANRGKCCAGYRGVSFHKRDKRWRARIGLSGLPGEGRQCEVHIGNFGSEDEAARAYDAVAREWYGPYARLNFPEGSQ